MENEQIRARFQDLDRQIYHVDLRAQARTEESFKRLLLASVVIMGLAFAFGGFFFTKSFGVVLLDAKDTVRQLEQRVEQSGELVARVDIAYRRLSETEATVRDLQRILETGEAQSDSGSAIPSSAQFLSSRLTDLQQSLAKLEESVGDAELLELRRDLTNLEVALATSPEKALAVPLIRNDLDHLKETTSLDLDDVRKDLATIETRLYAITGTGVVIAIGFLGAVFAPLIGPIITRRERKGEVYGVSIADSAEPRPAEDR